ncbi:hypothetical protein HK407_08g13280 [Ordospora pajunii]|uniref:uncharacterized protein n=1 Tax=Ordospora pajunii TaxID=3039483 RepID=UPI00295283F8|nr:uncharacterized protein HK407_08g13280 [Ordospora pajunii]KAH9411054.1 hypothetical protein HK407_08g13280 [Ordospora pajunii]
MSSMLLSSAVIPSKTSALSTDIRSSMASASIMPHSISAAPQSTISSLMKKMPEIEKVKELSPSDINKILEDCNDCERVDQVLVYRNGDSFTDYSGNIKFQERDGKLVDASGLFIGKDCGCPKEEIPEMGKLSETGLYQDKQVSSQSCQKQANAIEKIYSSVDIIQSQSMAMSVHSESTYSSVMPASGMAGSALSASVSSSVDIPSSVASNAPSNGSSSSGASPSSISQATNAMQSSQAASVSSVSSTAQPSSNIQASMSNQQSAQPTAINNPEVLNSLQEPAPSVAMLPEVIQQSSVITSLPQPINVNAQAGGEQDINKSSPAQNAPCSVSPSISIKAIRVRYNDDCKNESDVDGCKQIIESEKPKEVTITAPPETITKTEKIELPPTTIIKELTIIKPPCTIEKEVIITQEVTQEPEVIVQQKTIVEPTTIVEYKTIEVTATATEIMHETTTTTVTQTKEAKVSISTVYVEALKKTKIPDEGYVKTINTTIVLDDPSEVPEEIECEEECECQGDKCMNPCGKIRCVSSE